MAELLRKVWAVTGDALHALGWFGLLGLAFVFIAGGAIGYLIRRWDSD